MKSILIVSYTHLDVYKRQVYKIKHELGKAAMKMKYSDVETTRIRDFMELAKDGAQYTQLIDCIVSIISAIVTAAGLFAIILTLQPIIFVFVLLTVCTRLFAERENRKLWEKWRPIYLSLIHIFIRTTNTTPAII